MARLAILLGASALALPTLTAAQTLPIPLDNSSIAPTASAPVVAPTPTPTPVPSPAVVPTPTPTSTATPAPDAAATPSAPLTSRPTTAAASADREEPTPAASGTPGPAPTPAAATATPAAPIETVVLPRQPHGAVPLWPWFAGGAAFLLALAAMLLRRRRAAEEFWENAPAEPDLPQPAPPAPAGRARLAIALRPTRAGVNLLTVTLEAEVTLTNIGGTAASDIRAVVALTGANGDEPALIERLAAQPIAKPDTAPFALAPGEARRFRAVAAVPLDAIEPLSVADRPLFVPLAVATVAWRDGTSPRRTSQGFAVGVERADAAKLAPLWLDIPPRSYDSVAARGHGDPLET